MGPKKKAKGKAGSNAEKGILDNEKKAKLLESALCSLEIQLAGRTNDTIDANAERKKQLKEIEQLRMKIEEAHRDTYEITRDMTRQYKGMQEELLERINQLEGVIQGLHDTIENANITVEQITLEKEAAIEAKEKEIELGNRKMEEMADEFSAMLKETLNKMQEHIDIGEIDRNGNQSLHLCGLIDEINSNYLDERKIK